MARSRGASFAWLLRLFLAGAAVATLGLLYTTHAQHAVNDAPLAAEPPKPKAPLKKPDAASGCPAQGCPPRFWAPVSIAGVEHGDPRVSLCKLAFDTYWRDPSKTPMFRDLASASRCGRGRTGTLNQLYEDMRKKGIKPVKPSGFVFHESRVGSTLVANMLAAVPTNIVYSESAPPPAVLNHCRSCSKQRKTDILQKLIALMGASPTNYHTHLFFKFQSATVPNIRSLLDAFPETPWLFVYRDPVQTMMSHFKNGVGNGPCLRQRRSPPPATIKILKAESAAKASRTSPENYCAAHLAMLTSSALDADGSSDRGLLVDYASMPGALEAYVFPKHFGLSLAPEDALRTHAASSVYSKARGGRKAGAWESDNEKKERAATPAIKSAAATYLQPTFERARQATLSRTGGDDLVHFRDFAP